MKTYRNLFPQITSFANLDFAFRRARRGKRDRPEVAAFEYDLEPNLFALESIRQAQTSIADGRIADCKLLMTPADASRITFDA